MMDDQVLADTLPPYASTTTAVFDNSSVWHNFTLWTAQRLGYAFNVSGLAPALEDIVWAGPRMVMKLGRLGSFISFPDAIDGFGQRGIPESTDPHMFDSASAATTTTTATMSTATTTTLTGAAAASFLQAVPLATEAATQDPTAFVSRFSLEGARGLGSVFSYATSKWALCCIAMAVVFNRTHIFAATRRRLRLRWKVRLFLRLPLIVLLLLQARRILQSIQCQTSPDFAELRWGDANKSSDLMFSETNTLLHGLSSTLLFGASDQASCRSVKMVPWGDQETSELRGSLSRLWPLFSTLCASQFVEVLSATLQGRPVAAETGMTLFEHSLAFAEADAAISNQLGWGLFSNSTNASQTAAGSAIAVTRGMIMKRVNTPPEVLLVAFLSAMSHVTSHILGVFNLQSKFRLISTGVWGLCFMGSIMWSALTFSLDDTSGQGLLRFPTVCIIGFIPHVLVFAGIFICGFIYFFTIGLSAIATPEVTSDGERLTLRGRLAQAHANMQANVSISDIRIRMDMDFYTALLRAGFGAITMASEAVYLNEDSRVNLKSHTWLEDERYREIEELKMQWLGGGVPGSRFDSVGAIGLVPIKDGQANATSGYARERAAQKIPKTSGSARRLRDGVGAAERSGRWLLALEYIMHISRLVLTTWTLVVIKLLSYMGVRNPPRWLRSLSQRAKPAEPSINHKRTERNERGTAIATWSSDGQQFAVPRSERLDLEAEMRRRAADTVDEAEVDSKLYNWWLNGGYWGSADASGEYVPPARHNPDTGIEDPDFDTTSVISATETIGDSEFGWESDPDDDSNIDESLEDGQRTPTQRSFASALAAARAGGATPSTTTSARSSRESTPLVDSPMAISDLARLLHPQSPEEREEAAALAAHLSSDSIMTRSRFRQHQQRQRAQVLLTPYQRRQFAMNRGKEKMTPEEEARWLEQILISRREAAAATIDSASAAGDTWATGAAGLGPDGPQCVVCQSSPRTIIVWPCRCLSLCDDCRVTLAMNNFDKCVCCRREVVSFSRIFVP